MTPAQESVFKYLRQRCYDRRTTPDQKEIAKALGLDHRYVSMVMSVLREGGLVRSYRNKCGPILGYGVRVNGEWRWTQPPLRPKGRHPHHGPEEYGAGPIARMLNRDRAEEKIAEIYDGRRYDLNGFRPHEFKEAYAAKRAAE